MVTSGPELTKKRVAALLIAAAVIVLLFSLRTCREANVEKPVDDDVPELVISQFDSLFREYADTVVDWKLLAAIACVESEFDTSKVSSKGAFGLMQVMPSTYRDMVGRIGVDSDSVSTELNIYAAVQQLSDMNSLFLFINPSERINYVLGAYNCGHGHVFDAMRIARSTGVNRYRWSNIEDVMSTMSEDNELCSDTTVCRYGTFNWQETVGFVRKVMNRYQEYCRMDSLAADGIIPDA